MIKALTYARVVMLQVEGPKVRSKGLEQWETVRVLVLVQEYLGSLGSTWNANPNMILDPPHPNAPTIVATCHLHRVHIPIITISTIMMMIMMMIIINNNDNLLIPILPLITWYVTNHTTTRYANPSIGSSFFFFFCLVQLQV